jgi:hypothetical protein
LEHFERDLEKVRSYLQHFVDNIHEVLLLVNGPLGEDEPEGAGLALFGEGDLDLQLTPENQERDEDLSEGGHHGFFEVPHLDGIVRGR